MKTIRNPGVRTEAAQAGMQAAQINMDRSAPTQGQAAVPRELDRLTAMLDNVESAFVELVGTLAPVLRNAEPADVNPENRCSYSHCNLSHILSERADRLSYLAQAIAEVHSRLEV